MVTNRSVIERERKQARQKRQQEQQVQQPPSPAQEPDLQRLSSPATQTAPPQRVTTPAKASKYVNKNRVDP